MAAVAQKPSAQEIESAKAVIEAAQKAEAVREAEEQKKFEADVEAFIGNAFGQPVVEFTVRDGESVGYNAFSRLDFGRSIESTMFFSARLGNGASVHFGIGAIRGSEEASILLQHPDGVRGFLCIHRAFSQSRFGSEEAKAKDAQTNREFWVKSAKLFGYRLANFEKLIAHVAKNLCTASGMHYDEDTWRAPIKKKVISYTWE